MPAMNAFLALFASTAAATPAQPDAFEIQAVDDQTGRGVPLVEFEMVNRLRFVTDNAGRVAFSEPGLMGREVFFSVRSHGYEFPKDGFGFRGLRLATKAGGRAEVKLKRLNIAERLYRVTGEGLYRDSVLLGKKPPISEPLLNAEILGQDSVQAWPYRGKLYWFWGDTLRLRYPLGLFRTSGATSEIPGQGGLDPSIGVELRYFAGADGFSRAMAELPNPEGVVWIDGVCAVPDASGRERLVCHYSRRKGLADELEQGIAVFDDERALFEPRRQLPLAEKWRFPHGHPVRVAEGGAAWIYTGHPALCVRVPAVLDSLLDPARYEAWTGREWSRSGEPDPKIALVDAETGGAESGQPVKIHGGSVRWNAHRKRWILIGLQEGGQSSLLGEVWYAEAPSPVGPWKKGRKVVTHDRYSFYNPCHHDFFDREGGRFIHFEGTYAETFSGNPVATPRYDYNQMMYSLDLDDPRLRISQA